MKRYKTNDTNNFISIFNYNVDKDTCTGLIELFEKANSGGHTQEGRTGLEIDRKRKDSLDLNSTYLSDELKKGYEITLNNYFQHLNSAYSKYIKRYEELKYPKTYHNGIVSYNIQRYNPNGQAYHAWHYESPHPLVCNRVLAWMSYLNTVKKGGETEFKYYNLKVSPQQGTTLIWPASFTHTHRGLTAPKETKYIITGWFELLNP